MLKYFSHVTIEMHKRERNRIMAKDTRRFSVRINIDVPAPYFTETHQNLTFENLLRYFTTGQFSSSVKIHIVKFLNGTRAMGGTIEKYIYPMDSEDKYVQFEVEIPIGEVGYFETEFYNYIYPRPA